MVDMIQRPDYLEHLLQNRDVKLIKVVAEIRRRGKASFMEQSFSFMQVPNI